MENCLQLKACSIVIPYNAQYLLNSSKVYVLPRSFHTHHALCLIVVSASSSMSSTYSGFKVSLKRQADFFILYAILEKVDIYERFSCIISECQIYCRRIPIHDYADMFRPTETSS